MAQDDEGTRDDDADKDRQVILARRQRFIALALAGLGGTSCAGRAAQSESPEQANAVDSEEPSNPDGVDPLDKPPPRPPKKLEPTRRKWTSPQACLRVALPEDETP